MAQPHTRLLHLLKKLGTVTPKIPERAARKMHRTNHYLFGALAVANLIFLTACSGVGTTVPSRPEPQATPRVIEKPPQEPAPAPQAPLPVPTEITPPAKVTKPADLVFFDNFEYIVGRSDANATNLFQQHGKWHGAKTIHSRERANGYLYTSTSIPGYNGVFPGGNSRHVLVMEALPNSRGFQTDFYLEYGDGENPVFNNAVPGNVWFQFWIYVNHYGNQRSKFDARNKFIYACNTAYPCHSHKWMLSLGTYSTQPRQQSLGMPSNGDAFLNNGINTEVATVVNTTLPAGEEWKLGQTNTSERITANRWTLVKIHLDTSTQSGRYEAWMRPLGGPWAKVVEWIDGVTPGFSWKINANQIGGHRTFRMPTTIGRARQLAQNYDAWIYLDDFAMARSEAGLPQYGR
jgi:hypothetical protein